MNHFWEPGATAAQLWNALFGDSPFAAIVVSRDGVVLAANSAVERILGWKASEIEGGQYPLMRKDNGDPVYSLHELALAGSAFGGAEIKVSRKDGAQVSLQLAMIPVQGPDRIVSAAVHLLEDVSWRERFRHMRLHCENRFAQEVRAETVARISSGIAHDFNNLLTIMLGNIELMLMTVDKASPAYPMLQEIEKSAARFVELVGKLQSHGRRQALSLTAVSPAVLLRAALDGIKDILGDSVRLESELDETTGEIEADIGKLRNVFCNIATVSAATMPEGGVFSIRISRVSLDAEACRLLSAPAAGEYVLFEFKDTGCGFDEDVLSALFEPYQPLKAGRARAGLELFTVKTVVENHGGAVSVESKVGAGAVFRLYLPVARQRTAADAGVALLDRPPTVMLVDNDLGGRRRNAAYLASAGYNVLQSCVDDALATAGGHGGKTDIMVFYFSMLTIAMRHTLAALREKYSSAGLVFASEQVPPELARLFFGIECDGFLPCPHSPHVLAAVVRSIYSKLGPGRKHEKSA